MRAAHTFDGIVAHTRLQDMPAWMVRLLEQREALPPAAFDAAVVSAIRTHLFGDYEDPGRDPDLGGPIG